MRARIITSGVLALVWLASATPALAQRAEKFVLRAGGSYVLAGGGTPIDDGPAAGGTLGINFLPHAWLLGGYSYMWLEGEDDTARWDAQAIVGMLGYDIVPTGMNGNWIFYAGAGTIRFDPDSAALGRRSYLVLSVGTQLVYDFSRHVAASLELGVGVALADEPPVRGDVWLFPLGLGLALRF